MVSTVNQSTKVLKKEHCSVKFGHLKGFFNSSTCSPRTMATMHCPLLQSTIRHCAQLGNILVAGAPIFSQKLISNIRCKYSSIIFIITQVGDSVARGQEEGNVRIQQKRDVSQNFWRDRIHELGPLIGPSSQTKLCQGGI